MDLNHIQLSICICSLLICVVKVVTSSNAVEIMEEGLYAKSDDVVILGTENVDYYLYEDPKPWFIQFYYSICGSCRSLRLYFKKFLVHVKRWRKVLNVGVLDCIQPKNVETCRAFNIGKGPNLRYYHEKLHKPDKKGLIIPTPASNQADVDLMTNLLTVLKEEQKQGRFKIGPILQIKLLLSLTDVPPDAFIIFEKDYSNIGSEVLLDTMQYNKTINLVLGLSNSPLAKDLGLYSFPALIVVVTPEQVEEITPKIPNRENIVKLLDSYLGYETNNIINDIEKTLIILPGARNDTALLDDLEASLKVILFAEILLSPHIKEEKYEALSNFINVLIDYFPFRANGKEFLLDLKSALLRENSISGEELQKLLADLSNKHHPIWATSAKHVKCRGSHPKYRGATCGIWVMFHTMTVEAAKVGCGESQLVLNAVLDYAKYFFGCAECAEHFKDMATELELLKPKNNKDSILWLWCAHNIVNKRLSGGTTDDPVFPKVQFPTQERCPSCFGSPSEKNKYGWILDSVYDYLIKIYSVNHTSDVVKAC